MFRFPWDNYVLNLVLGTILVMYGERSDSVHQSLLGAALIVSGAINQHRFNDMR